MLGGADRVTVPVLCAVWGPSGRVLIRLGRNRQQSFTKLIVADCVASGQVKAPHNIQQLLLGWLMAQPFEEAADILLVYEGFVCDGPEEDARIKTVQGHQIIF